MMTKKEFKKTILKDYVISYLDLELGIGYDNELYYVLRKVKNSDDYDYINKMAYDTEEEAAEAALTYAVTNNIQFEDDILKESVSYDIPIDDMPNDEEEDAEEDSENEEDEEAIKSKSKNKKKRSAKTAEAKADTKPKYQGPRTIRVFGKDIYIEEDYTLSDEFIRAKLVEKYNMPNMTSSNTCFVQDDSTGIVDVFMKFNSKG